MNASLGALTIDVSAAGTAPVGPEERAIAGEELWLPPGGSAGVIVTERTALQLSALLATHNVLATDVAVLPLCTYRRQADGGRVEDRAHPVDRLLRVSPDGETTPLRWKQALMGHALSCGNGYAEVQRKGRGTPVALHLLDPDTTRPKRQGDRLGYELDGGRWLESANVLHVAGMGRDGLCGYNFVRMLRQAIGLGLAGETYAADYFSNGAEPGIVLEVPNKLDKVAAENLRSSWNARHAGPGQRHGTAVLEQGTKANTISVDPEKSQLLETRKFQVLDAVRPWRVPPHKVGDFSEAHLANLESANLDYLMTALMGWLTGIEQEFTLKLFSRAEQDAGYYVEHNVNALLRGDSRGRFEAYNTALLGGWMSRDEVRRRENMNPIGAEGGGDLYLVQSQNIPLDQAGKAPAAPGAPPPTPGNRFLRNGHDLLEPAGVAMGDERHNPNHGKDGKFSSGKGGGGVVGGGAAPEAPRDFAGKTVAEVDSYHATLSEGHVAALDGDERGAVTVYSTYLGKEINTLNRRGEVVPGYDKAELRQVSDVLDRAIGKASLPEPVTVYRGTKDPKNLGLKVGAVVRDKGFMSTSLDPVVATDFMSSKGGAIIKISAPKGAKGLAVGDLSQHKEREVLFARNTRIKVTGTSTSPQGRMVYHAEMLP